MEAPSYKEIKQQNSYKIYFPEKVFGKATKNRREDPNMFELLSWGSDGFEKHSFKKDEKFKQPAQAYLNMIGKSPWTSQCQESYVNYHQRCIQANPDVLNKIQNYIEERLPYCQKIENKTPHKNTKKVEKKLVISQKQDKKENKCQIGNYLSPKAASKKYIEQDQQAGRNVRKNSCDQHQKQGKKAKLKDQHKLQNQPKQVNKAFGFQKTKTEEHQVTQNEQQKLIEHFKQTTRWIPNSSFTTYFGKPPFENYGRGNTHPIDGGLVYGTYLYSHNVHPHRGKNNPKFVQSYPVALMKAKSQGTLVPTHPRTKPDFSQDASFSGPEKDYQSKIQPEANCFMGNLNIEVPKLNQIQKFGGKRGMKGSRATTTGIKNV